MFTCNVFGTVFLHRTLQRNLIAARITESTRRPRDTGLHEGLEKLASVFRTGGLGSRHRLEDCDFSLHFTPLFSSTLKALHSYFHILL